MIICFLPLCSETVTAQRNEEMNFLQVELGARTRRSSFACDVLPLSYLAPLFAQYYQSQSVALMTVAFHQQTACLGHSLLLMQIFKVLQTEHKMVRKSLHPILKTVFIKLSHLPFFWTFLFHSRLPTLQLCLVAIVDYFF